MGDPAVMAILVKVMDAIENGNLPQAQRALEPALEKAPQHQGLRAAHALLLLRQGDVNRAGDVAESLAAEDVREYRAIYAITHVLQQACRWHALAATYERIASFIPDKKGAYENLFTTNVRMAKFAEAQKVALTILNRQWPTPQYQLWGAICAVAQVPPDDHSHLLLKISARLLESLLGKEGVPPMPVATLYNTVLVRSQRHEDSIKFLLSSEGKSVGLANSRLELLQHTHAALGHWRDAVAIARRLIENEPDNWCYWEMYFEALEHAWAEPPSEGGAKPVTLSLADGEVVLPCDASELDAATFITGLCSVNASSQKPQRGPFMAMLELTNRRISKGTLAPAAIIPPLQTYVERFASKPCCFLDIVKYFPISDTAAIDACFPRAEHEPGTVPEHQMRILKLKCTLLQKYDFSVSDAAERQIYSLVQECVAGYRQAEHLSESLAWSEEGHCDGYISTALNALLYLFAATHHHKHLCVMLVLLAAVKRKLNNPTWLMISVAAYQHLGLADLRSLQQLDYKSLQLDSMQHVGFWPLMSGCALKKAREWCTKSEMFYGTLDRDFANLRGKVCQFSSWQKLAEIDSLERAMKYSIGRFESHVYFTVMSLAECETQKDYQDLMTSSTSFIQDVLCNTYPMQCNEDQDVLRAMVYAKMRSETQDRMKNALFPTRILTERTAEVRALAASLALLHDISAFRDAMRLAQQQPGAAKGKRAKQRIDPNEVLPTLSKSLLLQNGVTAAGVIASSLETLPQLKWLHGVVAALERIVSAVTHGAPLDTAAADASVITAINETVPSCFASIALSCHAPIVVGVMSQLVGEPELNLGCWTEALEAKLVRWKADAVQALVQLECCSSVVQEYSLQEGYEAALREVQEGRAEMQRSVEERVHALTVELGGLRRLHVAKTK